MASLYYNKLAIVAVTVSEAAAGYPGSNWASEALGKPWYSTTNAANPVIFDLGSSQAIDSLFVHDVNFSAATVSSSNDNVTYTAVGTLNTYAGRHRRRRGRITVGAAARYLKLVPTGVPSDGLAYWRGGAAYVFGSSVTPTAFPKYSMRVTTDRPRIVNALANRLTAIASTGFNRDRIELTIDAKDTETADDFIQRPLDGSVLLDLALPNYPAQLWPVRHEEEQSAEDFDRPKHSVFAIPYMEIVGPT